MSKYGGMVNAKKRAHYLAVAMAAGVMPCWLQAAAAGVDEELFFESLPRIVTVTRLVQGPLETPVAVTVIDRRMIEASGAVDVPDLLRLAAGFQVGHPVGTRTTVTYHGMTDEFARRMQVLVDGRSVYTALFGGVEWPLLALTLEDIERIEVTRGPNGVTYGANSFLGVINIITVHPAAVEGSYVKAEVSEQGYSKEIVRQAGRSDNFDYRVTLEHRTDNGLGDSELNGINQYRDDKVLNHLSFRGDYRAGVNDYMSLQLGGNRDRLGDGEEFSLSNPARDSDSRAHFEQFSWTHLKAEERETELRLYHDYLDIQNSYQTVPLSVLFGVSPAAIQLYLGVPDQTVTVDTSRTTDRYNAELLQRYRLTQNLRAVSGVEARLDRAKAPGLLGADGWIDSTLYRFFTNGEWRAAPDWLFNIGAMVEHNDIVGSKTSPRFALNYSLNPNQALRLSYTRAYRTPAMLEKYSDFAATYTQSGGVADQLWKSDGQLAAERMDAWELGLVGEHGNGVGYDVKIFQEKMRDLITTPTDYAFPEANCTPFWSVVYPPFCHTLVYENYGYAVTTGGELQLNYRPDSRRLLSFAWSHLFKREGDSLVGVHAPQNSYLSMVSWRPEDTLTLLLEQGFGAGVTASALVHHVDSWLVSGDRNNVRYTTANLRLAKGFQLSGGKGKVAVSFNDLLGGYYDFYYYTPTTPKVYLSLEVGL